VVELGILFREEERDYAVLSRIMQEIEMEHKKCYFADYFTATLCFLGVGAIVFFGT
jgi:hypothetical protein